MLSVLGRHLQRVLHRRLRQLRGRLLHGRGGDGRIELHSVRCRHLQHRRDQHGLHFMRRQQLLEYGGDGRIELHGLPDEQCSGGGSDELLL